ncbi:MAG: dihydrofolate reductase family protein [Opitutales bacterium]
MEVIAIAAQSLDGCITRHQASGSSFASEADRVWFAEALAGCDCLVMGRGTYVASRAFIRSRLTPDRCRHVLTRRPRDWVEDRVAGQLMFTDEAPAVLIDRLAEEGNQRCGVLGGAEIYSRLLLDGRLTRLWLTLEPRIFGQGIRLVNTAMDPPLQLKEARPLEGGSLLLDYVVGTVSG